MIEMAMAKVAEATKDEDHQEEAREGEAPR
jgi:hypothetical protein